MSEDTASYTAPGVRALQAGWERATHEAEAERETRIAALRETQDLRDQLRRQQAATQEYKALVLAYMPPLHRATLQAVAYLTRIESYPASAPGWIVLWAIRKQVLKPLSNSALRTLVIRGLLEYNNGNCYRLTPFGAQVAAALGAG